MPKFTLEINTDNAAFYPFPGYELRRLLREIADGIVDEDNAGDAGDEPVFDSNGNRCGHWTWEVDGERKG